MKLVSRAGKLGKNRTGKYSNCWNTETVDGWKWCIDFGKDILKWEGTNNNNHNPVETLFTEAYKSNLSNEVMKAKLTELNNWETRQVFEEEADNGQTCISTRWVLKPKLINGIYTTSARLCARGFEETSNFRTDSPTCSKIGVRLVLTIISSKSWTLNSIDVKTAFLQGKRIERTVYLRPPKEAKTTNIWRLKKCVYGLSDASRYWYLKFREELLKLGAYVSKLDQGIFVWFDNNKVIFGIISCFVDDVIWGGCNGFNDIIEKLKQKFEISIENSKAFTYIGIDINQLHDKTICINQNSYVSSINPIPLSDEQSSHLHDKVTEEERSLYRAAIGQLIWVASSSRPEISFDVCEASTKVTSAIIADIVKINKVIKYVKSTSSFIKFPKLQLDSLHIKTFTDASFNNLPNGGSQGGQILFLCDKMNNCSPLVWSSTKIKRVVRSTLAAETMSATEGCDTAFFISKLVREVLPQSTCPIEILTDNQSLFDTINTSHQISDKRLQVEVSSLREMSERGEINLYWIQKERQLSGCTWRQSTVGTSSSSVTI